MSNTTKNSMPSFAQGTYENIQKLIADGGVNAPAFVYFTDKECLGFLDGKKTLHVVLWDKVNELEEQMEGLKDPTTGEPIKVTDYVDETVTPVAEKVDTVQADVETIKQNGASILITSDTNGGA